MNTLNGAAQETLAKDQPQPDVLEASQSKPRILVIDDEAGLRQMLTYSLGLRGYEVITAANGEEGVEQAKKTPFDVVVSDLTMPKMGGLDALALLKDTDPKLEVIIATGYATIESAIQCMKRGAYDYIMKPFQIEDLCRLVERALEKRRLNKRVDKLQELNRLKSEFLANMSHELRTPMNAIIGYTSLILDGVYGQIPDKAQQALGRVGTNAKNLLELINNILDLSKLTAGRMPVYIENCNLFELAKEVTEILNVLASGKNLKLDFEAAEELSIPTDKTKLKQVLINLVGNGIKFTREGGVSIKIKRQENAPSVQILVRDTGIGMKTEDMVSLFEEFKQLDASSTREFGGTGLGLCISKKIVELLGGSIKVDSALNVGSAFTITLPVDNKRVKDDLITPRNTDAENSEKKVLLAIDDDPEVLTLIKDSLEGSGFSFVGAQSGEEGLAIARKLKPTVITLDIMMPHLDGWSVLQLIKSDPKLAPIPVIILSIMENKALGFSLGIADYIVKPFERQILLSKLKSLERKLNGKKRCANILLVDDDPSITEFLQEAFRQDGMQMTVARNGADALAAMSREKPDLLFLDLMLPHVNGFDVLELTQKDPEFSDIPVIVITAQHLTPHETEYLEKRVAMIIQKESINLPEVFDQLKKRIEGIKEVSRG